MCIEKGIFLEELKNRFRCLVELKGEKEICYVPSSCRLTNLIDLKGKEVSVRPIKKSNSGIKYSLFSARLNKNIVLLDLSEANRVIEKTIHTRRFCYLGKRQKVQRERVVENYKTDFYIEDTQTIIEIKTVLCDKTEGNFPSVYSERSERQLVCLNDLLIKGYKVLYIIIALNPKTRKIILDEGNTPYSAKFSKCIKNGMLVKAYSLKIVDENVVIRKEIPFIMRLVKM